MNKLFNIDVRNWVIVGLILFIIILFFWKPCNKPDEKVAELKAENKELHKQAARVRDSIEQVREQFSRDSTDARGREQLALQEKQEADNKVKQQQRTIDRLAATIRQSNNTPIDTATAVLVSRDYKDACDSFPPENDKLRAQLAEKDSAINDWSEILAYEVQLRDSAIEAEQAHSARINDLYNRQNRITEEALKAAKRRGMFLVGAGNLFLPGDTFNPHIAAAYQNKDGKQFQGKVGIVNGKQYYEGTALIPLFK